MPCILRRAYSDSEREINVSTYLGEIAYFIVVCVCIVPFGFPVLPLVVGRNITSLSTSTFILVGHAIELKRKILLFSRMYS